MDPFVATDHATSIAPQAKDASSNCGSWNFISGNSTASASLTAVSAGPRLLGRMVLHGHVCIAIDNVLARVTDTNFNTNTSVICKLVFFQENERLGNTSLEDVPEEIDNLLPHNNDGHLPSNNDPELGSGTEDSGWVAVSVAREYNIRQLFELFVEKLSCTLPADAAPWRKARDERDSLYAIASIQHTMLNGFVKRIERQTSATTSQPVAQSFADINRASNGPSQVAWQGSRPIRVDANGQPGGILSMPFSNFMNFDSINFDGIAPPLSTFSLQGGDEVYSDWMWDMVMDDFTMPSM